MSNALDLDTILDVCGHKHRRIVLAALANQQQSLSIDDLTNAIIKHNHPLPRTEIDDETANRIYLCLYHVHVPKLAEAGVIHYDPERNVAELTVQARRESSHLSAILAQDSDLPITH